MMLISFHAQWIFYSRLFLLLIELRLLPNVCYDIIVCVYSAVLLDNPMLLERFR